MTWQGLAGGRDGGWPVFFGEILQGVLEDGNDAEPPLPNES